MRAAGPKINLSELVPRGTRSFPTVLALEVFAMAVLRETVMLLCYAAHPGTGFRSASGGQQEVCQPQERRRWKDLSKSVRKRVVWYWKRVKLLRRNRASKIGLRAVVYICTVGFGGAHQTLGVNLGRSFCLRSPRRARIARGYQATAKPLTAAGKLASALVCCLYRTNP